LFSKYRAAFTVDKIFAFIAALETGHWIAIAAIVVGSFFGSFTVANYLAGRRERKLRTYESTPQVKATINRKAYKDGWRSVQFHMVAAEDHPQNFQYGNWQIERARLLRPWSAILARAENDDYATGVFYPENPVRELAGKPVGRLQRFALEFFIKFKGADDKGLRAKFKVTFSHINGSRRRTVKMWVTVPTDAE
jgi:hypothetical protein